MHTEDQLLPLSALQHWLYCPRQCALIHLEQVWAENKFTAEGQNLHKKAHEGPDETRAGVRITRSLPVRSLTLGISGQCDVVEFHPVGRNPQSDLRSEISNLKCAQRIVPVEYKRGKPKSHRADEVQLCAQAMCLEEMLGVEISEGCLYYGENRRRSEVVFAPELRQLVRETAASLHGMMDRRLTPVAEYEARRCDACSLIELCQPKAMRFGRGAAAWFSTALKSRI
jgi:CRISPR-associated exonuclease Cas4